MFFFLLANYIIKIYRKPFHYCEEEKTSPEIVYSARELKVSDVHSKWPTEFSSANGNLHILRHMYRRRQTWGTFAQISSEWVPKICFRFYGLQLSKFYAVRGELMPSYICVAFSKRNPFVNFLWLIHSHSFCIKNRFQNYTTSLPRKNQQKKFSLYLNPQTSAPSRKKEQEKQFSFVSCFILVMSPFERLLINGIIYKKFIA